MDRYYRCTHVDVSKQKAEVFSMQIDEKHKHITGILFSININIVGIGRAKVLQIH